jgi:hypothetical protein
MEPLDGPKRTKKLRDLWDRSLPEIIAGLVAGFVLLIVPPVAKAVAGVSVEINPIYLVAAFALGGLVFGLYRFIKWIGAVAARFRELEAGLATVKTQTDVLSELIPLEQVIAYAEDSGWEVEHDESHIRLTLKSEHAEQSQEINFGESQKMSDDLKARVIFDAVSREKQSPTEDRIQRRLAPKR